MSSIFSLLNEQLLGKSVDVPCSMTDDLNTGFGSASIMIAIIVPTILGPVIITACHLLLCLFNLCFSTSGSLTAEERNKEIGDAMCIFLLTLVFLATYLSSMVLTELYIPLPSNLLCFVIVKHVFGTSHHFLGPVCIFLCKRDIRLNVGLVYRRGGSTQSQEIELTYEVIQKELGLGVDPKR